MSEFIPWAISILSLGAAISVTARNFSKESDYIKDKYRREGARNALEKLGLKDD